MEDQFREIDRLLERLVSDMTRSPAETLELLKYLREELDVRIEALEWDVRREK